ncbi:MAG: Pimeloyl-ACP methyl ester carboxylesterase [Chloroflexi bacterium]|jgi:pimeloyl-ACP methyl ester carboxylesterase|nr:MAG: Pimeloyl-ACP methyl ester carboxylesterase [Chloroflexota bacterium]
MEDAKFIDVNGTRTRYFEAGQGEPLLLIHGGQFGMYNSARDWDRNWEDFTKDFHVYALDKVGQGHSDNPARADDYLLGTATQHVYDFMQAVGLEKAHVAGHSRGGYLVARLALEHPEVVKSLIMIDSGSLMWSTPEFYEDLNKRAEAYTDVREKHRFILEGSSFAGTIATDEWLDDVTTYVDAPKNREAMATMAEMWPTLDIDHQKNRDDTHDWIRAGGLKDMPTLVIWAYDDQGAPIIKNGIPCMHLILPNVPNSQMHILNQSGHYVFREHPQEFNAVIRTFIHGL